MTNLSLGFALLWATHAVAQSKLGELLDAGARKLSAEEFKEEVVQRVIVGPTASGGSIEVMYAHTGVIQGRGTIPMSGGGTIGFVGMAPISGEWTMDDNGRVCTSMQIGIGVAASGGPLAPRCQFWFKYKDDYFFADSDSDRSARVLRRTVKQ